MLSRQEGNDEMLRDCFLPLERARKREAAAPKGIPLLLSVFIFSFLCLSLHGSSSSLALFLLFAEGSGTRPTSCIPGSPEASLSSSRKICPSGDHHPGGDDAADYKSEKEDFQDYDAAEPGQSVAEEERVFLLQAKRSRRHHDDEKSQGVGTTTGRGGGSAALEKGQEGQGRKGNLSVILHLREELRGQEKSSKKQAAAPSEEEVLGVLNQVPPADPDEVLAAANGAEQEGNAESPLVSQAEVEEGKLDDTGGGTLEDAAEKAKKFLYGILEKIHERGAFQTPVPLPPRSMLLEHLRLAFHVPLTLNQIQGNPDMGSIGGFLRVIKSELVRAGQTSDERLQILDIRGDPGPSVADAGEKKEDREDEDKINNNQNPAAPPWGGMVLLGMKEISHLLQLHRTPEAPVSPAAAIAAHLAEDPEQEPVLRKDYQSSSPVSPPASTTAAGNRSGPIPAASLAASYQAVQPPVPSAPVSGPGSMDPPVPGGAGAGVVIDLEIVPVHPAEEPIAEKVYENILQEMANPKSELMRGPLGGLVLAGATLSRGLEMIGEHDGYLPEIPCAKSGAEERRWNVGFSAEGLVLSVILIHNIVLLEFTCALF